MEATNKLTDKEILMRAVEDQGHLALLVKRYRTPLYNFVYRFVGDRETAEDIVQETFLRCLRHSHQYPAIEQVYWVQEESQNMGAWHFVRPHLDELLPADCDLGYVGRDEAASPATGSGKVHYSEQQEIVDQALDLRNQEMVLQTVGRASG